MSDLDFVLLEKADSQIYTVTLSSISSATNEFDVLKLSDCSYSQIYQRIFYTPLPKFGHVKYNSGLADKISQNDDSEADDSMIEDDQEHMQNCVPMPVLKHILAKALAWFFTRNSIVKLHTFGLMRFHLCYPQAVTYFVPLCLKQMIKKWKLMNSI